MTWRAGIGGWLASHLTRARADPQAVRAEIWALGGRHQGRVIEGATLEMLRPGLTLQRMALLQAVVRVERLKGVDAR